MNTSWKKCTVVVWALVLLVITVRLLVAHNLMRQSVYPPYIGAARNWIAGADLYGPDRMDFRYSPLFAVVFTPFTMFPDRAGNIVWRWLNFAAYLGAVVWWMRGVLRQPSKDKHWSIFLLSLLPLSAPSLNNGQANSLMVALMLCAMVLVNERRWMFASALLALAVHLKLYPLALALVLLALWPGELLWRQLLMGVASMALCFVAQSPGYVAAQFTGWFVHLSGDLRLDQAPLGAYRDLRLLLGVIGMKPSHGVYFAIQIVGAIAVAVACLKMKRSEMSRRRFHALVYAWVACWIMLLGPSTESSTFIVLAPALSWLLIEAWTAQRPLGLRAALVTVCLLFW